MRTMKSRLGVLAAVCGLLLAAAPALAGDRAHPKSRTSRTSRTSHALVNEDERSTEFWNAKAQATLAEKLERWQGLQTATGQGQDQGRAKNVIMFLGDGMSVHTVTATRNLVSDSAEQLSFERFPYVGLAKTYCVNRKVPDSACTATAYLAGVKANYGTIGLNAKVPRYDCLEGNDPAHFTESFAQWAQEAGKDTGFVTSARVTHATPAGVYGHTASRDWENDAEVSSSGCDPSVTTDIARQLVEWPVGRGLKVIMGGGRRNFINSTVNDEEGIAGLREDGRNLIAEWLQDKRDRNASAAYAWSKKGLGLIDLDRTDYLLGLFSSSHCPYHGDLERERLTNADPSLSEMTEAAIRVLRRNPEGFFLFVEGARIDMAHHDTRARKSLEDTEEMARAVQRALELTSAEDTLVVVTADHSHTMTINGYPYRGQDITGLSDKVADDELPYTILSYANGPGFYNTYSEEAGRLEITARQTWDPDYEYMASVPLVAETHGGDDVAVYAHGPFAQFFSGNYEQSNIPAMMARAAGIGPFANV